MDVLDPRLAIIAAGAAAVGSERARHAVGRGLGYAATGAIKVGKPVARAGREVGTPVVRAGREIVDEARAVAGGNGSS